MSESIWKGGRPPGQPAESAPLQGQKQHLLLLTRSELDYVVAALADFEGTKREQWDDGAVANHRYVLEKMSRSYEAPAGIEQIKAALEGQVKA